jgi:hypothetical protein
MVYRRGIFLRFFWRKKYLYGKAGPGKDPAEKEGDVAETEN